MTPRPPLWKVSTDMKRVALRLLALSLTLAAAAFSAPGPTRARATAASIADDLDAEEYAVISAVLISGRQDDGDAKTGGVLVIQDMTVAWHGFDDKPETFYAALKESSKELLDETIEDYKAKNKEPHKLSERLDAKVRYVLADTREIDGFFEKNGVSGWEDFYKKYPNSGGYFMFSRVGFNSDKTQALVYKAHGCGGLCGEGSCLLFVKKDGVWVAKGAVGAVWMS